MTHPIADVELDDFYARDAENDLHNLDGTRTRPPCSASAAVENTDGSSSRPHSPRPSVEGISSAPDGVAAASDGERPRRGSMAHPPSRDTQPGDLIDAAAAMVRTAAQKILAYDRLDHAAEAQGLAARLVRLGRKVHDD